MRGKGRQAHDGPPADEVAAIAACQKGDRTAYRLIVERYRARAIGIARNILRDTAAAEDVAQEAFVRAFKAIRRFDLEERFYPWFYRIVKNATLSALKRRRTGDVSLDNPDAPPLAAAPNDPSGAAARGELKRTVLGAMEQLSDAHREIVHLSHFEMLSYKEIAACLDIPIGTVMSRLWAARRALKKVLEPLMAAHE